MTALKIPHHKQINNYYCGPASLQMALGFFKYYKSQKFLAKELKTNKRHGTDNKQILMVAKKHGFDTYAKTNAKLSDIKFFLKNNLPVIVNYLEPSANEGHFAVVSDLDKNNIKLADPHHGKKFKLSRVKFIRRWHGKNKKYKKWLMVVSPKNK